MPGQETRAGLGANLKETEAKISTATIPHPGAVGLGEAWNRGMAAASAEQKGAENGVSVILSFSNILCVSVL